MARRGIKVKDGEDLSPQTVEKVKKLLEAEKPITKKDACAMLKISYNTTRLGRILQDYEDKLEFAKEQRKRVRGTPVSDSDAIMMIQSYLGGDSLTSISEDTFRSVQVVKNILKKFNVPLRDASNDYNNPPLLEDAAMSTDYDKGDLVYSARYGSPAYVDKRLPDNDEGPVYRIWVIGDGSQWAIQPFYELADLRVIQELGVKISELDSDEIKRLLYEAYMTSKRLKK